MSEERERPRERGRVIMPAVFETAERAEPTEKAQRGLKPVRDPAEVAAPGTADRPGWDDDEIGSAAQAAPPGVAHSSAVMAVGTIFSRLTGFLRTTVIAAALGGGLLADSYQVAEMIPYQVYELLLGGLLASVFVPFLVKRRRLGAADGEAAEQRLLTAALLGLTALTVLAVVLAGPLVAAYADGYTGRQREVTVLLTRWLLAQILFIGISGIASAMLNARGRFGSPMWAPVVNNLITMGAGLAFLSVAGPGRDLGAVTDGELSLLAAGSALGTVLQALVLAWALWRAGFRWRPRLDLRGSGFGEAVRNAAWMLVYIAVSQTALLVTVNVATRAGKRAALEGHPFAGPAVYKFAMVVFQLPYAIIAVSVITALLPRMSAHVADGRRDLVRTDFSRGVRLSAALLVPAGLGLLVLAVPVCVLLFAYGRMPVAGAERVGQILMVFALLLVPFVLFQLQMRVFYALGDTRTPGLLAIPAGLAQVAAAVAALKLAPPEHVVLWLPVAYGLFYLVGTAGATWVLRRRLRGMDGRRILRSLSLLHLAAVPGVAFAAGTVWAFAKLPGDRLPDLGAIVVGGLGGGLLYLGTARLLRIAEVGYFLDIARTRLRRA
ncbi:murein biosynthesis integral membrane protein MurJ [Spirillospora sp. CA-253888]